MRTREEKIEFIKTQITFPARVVFNLAFYDGKYHVLLQEYKNKQKQIRNIRFDEIRSYIMGGPMTPIEVLNIENAETCIEQATKLGREWGIGSEEA